MKTSSKTLTISSRCKWLFSTTVALALVVMSCSDEFLTSPDNNTNTVQLTKSNSSQPGTLSSSSSFFDLGEASSFAVLGGTGDVTLTDSDVTGDVGHFPGTSDVIVTNSTIDGTVNADAEQAHYDFSDAYDALGNLDCGTTLTGTLDNVTLTPGVYCFDAAATLTGTLTLDGQNDANAEWVFKIGTLGTGALTGTNFSVVMDNSGEACNVNWWVAEAVTLTDSHAKGNILAGAAITFTRGSLSGRAMSFADITLTGVAPFGGCGTGSGGTIPKKQEIKVTGGGQIEVDGGYATFGFKAQRKTGETKDMTKGRFNYVNHVTGLHINGPVDMIKIVGISDGISTVQFSGTSNSSGRNALSTTFVVTVEDHGEPGFYDEFGITVTGDASETTLQDVISNGNIQFHKK